MSVEQRPPRLVLAAQPLDEDSRKLVPRASKDVLVDERTARQHDEELPSTEPDGFGHDLLARERDSVISALKLLEEDRAKTAKDVPLPVPAGVLLPERPTEPTPGRSSPSDVFAPMGVRDHVLDEDAATPRDRPLRHIDEDKPTDLNPRQPATVTHLRDEPAQAERTEPLPERPRFERETEAEFRLVKSIYDTERVFFALKDIDPIRGAHIESLANHLKQSDAYSERDVVLAEHAREARALSTATLEQQRERENRVMAVALVAHELDDRYRAQISAHKERLVAEVDVLPPEKREAVLHDFESFLEHDASNDSAHCRRQMHEALKKEPELHKAYVYALALDRKQQRVADAQLRRDDDGVEQ